VGSHDPLNTLCAACQRERRLRAIDVVDIATVRLRPRHIFHNPTDDTSSVFYDPTKHSNVVFVSAIYAGSVPGPIERLGR
jgi:hypothetical protein